MLNIHLEFKELAVSFLARAGFSWSNCSLHWTAAASGSSTINSRSALSASHNPAYNLIIIYKLIFVLQRVSLY